MKRTKSELMDALNEALKTIKQLEAKAKSAEAQKKEKKEVKIYKIWTSTTKNGKNQTGDIHILDEKQATNQWNNYLKSFDNKSRPSGTIKQLINNKVEILQAKQWNMTTKKPNGGITK